MVTPSFCWVIVRTGKNGPRMSPHRIHPKIAAVIIAVSKSNLVSPIFTGCSSFKGTGLDSEASNTKIRYQPPSVALERRMCTNTTSSYRIMISCVHLAGPQYPDIWPNIFLDVSVKLLFSMRLLFKSYTIPSGRSLLISWRPWWRQMDLCWGRDLSANRGLSGSKDNLHWCGRGLWPTLQILQQQLPVFLPIDLRVDTDMARCEHAYTPVAVEAPITH